MLRCRGEIIFRSMAVELDEVDVQLLTALQADADRTNVELARLVGLSPAATLHRVRWLKDSGVIRIISARLDPGAAGQLPADPPADAALLAARTHAAAMPNPSARPVQSYRIATR